MDPGGTDGEALVRIYHHSPAGCADYQVRPIGSLDHKSQCAHL